MTSRPWRLCFRVDEEELGTSADHLVVAAKDLEPGWEEAMVTVWEDGELLRDWTFAQVRERAATGH